MQEFTTDGPLDASVRIGSGQVVVRRAADGAASADVRPLDATHEPSIRLAASAQVHLEGDQLFVAVPEHGRTFRRAEVLVELQLPACSQLLVKAGAATITSRDELSSLEAKIGAGKVDVDDVGDLVVKAGQVEVVVGSARTVVVSTGQGSLHADSVGDAAFKSGHGQVELGRTAGRVLVKGGMVDLTIRSAGAGEVAFTGGAGSARVGVVPGTTVHLDLTSGSGDVRCELPFESSAPTGGAALDLRLRTGSGDLLVMSAIPQRAE